MNAPYPPPEYSEYETAVDRAQAYEQGVRRGRLDGMIVGVLCGAISASFYFGLGRLIYGMVA